MIGKADRLGALTFVVHIGGQPIFSGNYIDQSRRGTAFYGVFLLLSLDILGGRAIEGWIYGTRER